MQTQNRRIPAPALVLGLLGLLPFLALAWGQRPPLPGVFWNRTWLLDYAAIILSFMGGAQWGLVAAATRDDSAQTSLASDGRQIGFGVSVVPALIAWAAEILPEPQRIAILAAGFAGLFVYDLLTVRQGRAPGWYGRLRLILTAGVLVCLGVGAAA